MSDYSDALSVCLIDSRVFVGDTLSRVFVGDPVSRVLHGRRPGGPSPGGGTVEREISDSDMVGGEREGGATSKRGGVSQRSPRPELDEAEYLWGEAPRLDAQRCDRLGREPLSTPSNRIAVSDGGTLGYASPEATPRLPR